MIQLSKKQKKMRINIKRFLRKFSFLGGIITGLFGFAIKAYAIFDTLATPVRIALEIITWASIIFGASFAFVYTSNAILGWVTTPGFIRVKVVDNPLVLEGWQVTRDFVNLFFILVVIWIGISIALRIGEGQAKKALPRLVIVALLINFTPVICGVIIDASNIVMNFFLSAGTSGYSNLLNISSLSGGVLLSSFEGLRGNWFDGSAWSAAFFQLLFVLAFNFIAGLVMLLMAVLFIVRHVALWVLVILSPLAFFAWIFPGGGKDKIGGIRRIWYTWWRQFIQWCFVGISAAFFLFLSQVTVTNIDKIANLNANPVVGPGGRVFLSSLFTQLIIYSIPLVLLLIGFFATIQSAPMGADVILKAAKKQAIKLPQRLKKAAGWGARKVGEKYEKLTPVERARERERERAKQRLEWKAQVKTPWITAKGERWKRATETIFMPTWRARKIAVKGTEQEIKDFNKLLEKYKKFETTEARLGALTRKGLSSTERAAIIRAMFEKGEMKKVPENLKKEVFEQLPNLPSEIRKKLIKAMPDIAEAKRKEMEAGIATAILNGDIKKAVKLQKEQERLGLALKKEDIDKGYRNLIEKVVGSASPKDIEKFDEKLLKSPEAQAAIHKFWTGREVSKAVEKFGKSFLDLFQEGLDKTGLEWYQQNNPRLYRYLRSNAAQNLGLAAPLSAQERKEKNIPLPAGFHGGKEWGVLTEEEKEKLKKQLESRKRPQELIKTLAKEAGFEALTDKDIQRILKSPLRILSRRERRLRQELQEIIREGGYQYLSRGTTIRSPSEEEVGESGIESQSFIEKPPEKTPPRKTRRYRRPPEEEV